MEKKDLQKLLSQPYKQDNWKQIVQFVFPNVSILSSPKEFSINNEKIKRFRQIGSVRLNDGKNLALFELLLADTVNIHRNRVELNNAISTHIDQEDFHGVLSVFDQEGDDYRFTFSAKSTEFDKEESDFVQKKTDTKRYTYILGKNESCKTPADRFYKLSENKSEVDINAIQNAFSVEQLSKEFFDKYKKQFEKFWKYIASKEEYKGVFINGQGEREVKIRNFTKKLLGRIVFLHFLQKKGWMGCPEQELWGAGDKKFMQNLFKDFTHKEQFHSKCLVELFYNTLNAKREDQLFSCEGLEGVLNNSKVPYLNGGLFDSDKLESTKIDFPESYFEDLFDFFGQYNFTIDENDPNDHEVGIDPEMLGHIFENLLEDNKDRGSFYTPKVIVQYMCQESLIEYLATKLEAETSGEVKQAIEELIRNHLKEDISDLDLVEPIAQSLFDVKICDPAIGSGAFPMGMLNVIYQVIEALHDLQPDTVARVWNISDSQWQPHLVKKNIIQHSIYGVDIESGAVDIARLRFWLALVVDEVEPLPLPNLDYKIMQGNSLLESFEGIDLSQISDAAAYEAVYESEQIELFSGEAKKKVRMSLQFEDVKSLMDDYFNANDPKTKKDLHKRIDDQVLNHIHFTLSEHKKELKKKSNKLEKKLSLDEAAARNWEQKEKIRTNSKAAKALVKLNAELAEHNEKEHKLAQISSSNERPFFLWHLFFQEVFENGGFDIVIGNPPYIQLQTMGNKKQIEFKKRGFQVYDGNGDIYCLFYEAGIELLRSEGILCYITSNKWLRTGYGKKLREFFISKNPIRLIDFSGNQIFSTASVDTNILLIKNQINQNYLEGISVSNELNFSRINLLGYYLKEFLIFKNLDSNPWSIIQKDELNVKLKIQNSGEILKNWNVEIFRGVTTGCNSVFIINEVLKNLLIKNDEIAKSFIYPVIKGAHMERYKFNWTNDYILFPRRGYDLECSKNIKDYLESNKERLTPKPKNWDTNKKWKGRKSGTYNWYEIQDNTKYYTEFEKEKVVWMNMNRQWKFAYAPKNYFVEASCNFIATNDFAHFLTGVLSSKLHLWYFRQTGRMFDDGGYMCKVDSISNFPVPNPSLNLKNKIENLVKKIITSSNECYEFTSQLDSYVYKLYNFTYEEILVVDQEFSVWMSKDEYNALRIE